MWIVDLFPDILIHIFVIASAIAVAASLFLKNVPIISKHATVINFISVITLCFGLWLEGGISMKSYYNQLVADMQLKISQAETKSVELNSELERLRRDNLEISRSVGSSVRRALEEHARKTLDATCTFDNNTIQLLNQLAVDPLKGKNK